MVSGHSGLPESVELRMLCEKHEQAKEKRDAQLRKIYAVLDKMPKQERNRMIIEVIKHYEEE